MDYDFRICKVCRSPRGEPTFELQNSTVYVCGACGFHYLDYLDTIDSPTARSLHPCSSEALDDDTHDYIENRLQSNRDRFERHIDLMRNHFDLSKKTILDIGCGGGLFLAKAKALGAKVTGIELDEERIRYAREVHDLEVLPFPVEHRYWDDFRGSFDAVTLWDVIEHVNFPIETLHAASRLLKPGGLLLLDTPSRNSLYHRVGVTTYRATGGTLPTFLDVLYSDHPYGHKQIIADDEMTRFLQRSGLELVDFQKIHELSFPYRFYLRKLLRSDLLAGITQPLAAGFFRIVTIPNKMIAVGKKKAS